MSLIGPARTVLEEAEKQNRTLGHENLGFLSAQYGIMPITPPLLSLPKSHHVWDDVIATLPHLYKRVSIRRALNELPLLSGSPEALEDRYLYRANTLLGILQQAYYRCEFGIPETIPFAIQQPLKEIATRLQRPHPGLNLNDVTICNWKFKDPSNTERTLQNMSLLFDVFSLPEDENFNLIMTELYAVSSPLIMSFVKAQEAMLAEDDLALQQELFFIMDVLKNLIFTLEKMQFPKYAFATFNPVIWAKTAGYFSMPLGDRSPRLSGGATSFIHLLDAFTGRKQYNSKLGIIEKRLIYLADSVHLKNFLKAIESVPLNEYVAKHHNKELSATVMSFMDIYAGKRGFLRRHRHKVYGFLESAVKMGMSMTAGGTEIKDVFLQRSWHKINSGLKASEKEHLESVPCRYPLVSSLETSKQNEYSPLATIKFDLKHSGLNYGKGDYLDVLILNADPIVEELITLFEVSEEHPIYLAAYWRDWLKRFGEYDDVEESLSIKRFLQLAKLYPLSKDGLQDIYSLTKLEKVGALLMQDNALNLSLLEVLKIIKEETAYNIQRFIYAEEWRPENISKWLSHNVCRPTYSFENNKEAYSIVSPKRNAQETNYDKKDQKQFYLSVEHAVRFNVYKKETPLVILAADEGVAPLITIINDVLGQEKSKEVYLFIALSEFFSDKRIIAIKQWLSASSSKVVIFDKKEPLKNIVPEFLTVLKEEKNVALLWALLRARQDNGKEGDFFICGTPYFVKNIFNTLDEIVRDSYTTEENQVGADNFLAAIRAKRRCDMHVLSVFPAEDEQKKLIPISDIVLHNHADLGYWIVIDDNVYDISKFIHLHYGGPITLLNQTGLDATAEYEQMDHHKDAIIQSMLAMYQIGRVEKLHFHHAWGVAPVDGQYRFMTVKEFWQLWTQKLYLLVEMENTLRNLFAFYPLVTANWSEKAEELILYKMQVTADAHNVFLHSYLQELFNRLPNLWSMVASMCSLTEDMSALQKQYDILKESEEYEHSAHIIVVLLDDIQIILKEKIALPLCYQHYHKLLEGLLALDQKIISDLKMQLRQGLMAFEKHHDTVLQKGKEELLSSLQETTELFKNYFHEVTKLYRKLATLPRGKG